jgi:hypothetical protein
VIAGESRDPRFARIGLAVLAAGWLAAIAALPLGYGPPASDTELDNERSLRTLRTIVGRQSPRPVESAENARSRARIVAELEAMGLEPRVERRQHCGERYPYCATVQNVVAQIDGRGADAVVLTAHYDSVRQGPGVSDDGAGVAAVLEVARALSREGPFENDVVFLIDDGEERGLLGAETFLLDPAWERTRMVVNLEARGVGGPSIFFESGAPNGLSVAAFAESPKPIGNSVAATIYALLPNDTDFTVYRENGRTGLNFAYIGSAQHYHTRRDDLRHLDLGSLRHHGENALAATRYLADADLGAERSQLVFFDFYSLFVVRYPEPVALGLALVVLAGALAWLVFGIRKHGLSLRGAMTGVMTSIGAPALAGGLGFGLAHVVAALGVPMRNWIGGGEAFLAGAGAIGLACVALARAISREAEARSLGAGVLVAWASVALVLALTVPGASYLASIPATLGLGAAFVRPPHRYPPIALGLGAAALVPPLVYFLYDSLATIGAAPAAFLVALAATPASPMLPAGKRGFGLAGGTFALGLGTAVAWAMLAH